jgi:hypothetical protein
MKTEALKLAERLDLMNRNMPPPEAIEASAIIRRLVEELDKLNGCLIAEQEHNEMLQTKPLSDEEIEYYEHLIAKLFNVSIQQKVVGLDRIIRAIEERHGIK